MMVHVRGLAFFSLILLGIALAVPGGARAQATSFHAISGVAYFDRNANGRRDYSEPLLSNVQPEEQINGQFVQSVGPGQSDGSYSVQIPTGATTIRVILPGPNGNASPALTSAPRTITVADRDVTGVDFGLTLPPVTHDARFFPETGYRIDSDLIWDYFNARGGVSTFGYPVSRTFPFLGARVQVFQRQILQIGGGVHELNLLDPDLMPITSVNFSTFPAFDRTLADQAPPVYGRTYATDVVRFVRAHAPDTWNGLPVRFYQTFVGAVSLQTAYPNGGGNPALLPLLNLEIWGLPTSQPDYDPNNHNFVYQRFQRGIMHYDATCHCTQGILLADTFKSVLTGQNLPADVAQQTAASPYLKLYDPTQVDAVVHVPQATASGTTMVPRVEGWTDLAFAFVPASS
jgi:hypothetical protein